MSLLLSVLDASGAHQFSAEFPNPKAARDFIAWRIEELLDDGAKYVVVSDGNAHAEGIADCIFLAVDWHYALASEAA